MDFARVLQRYIDQVGCTSKELSEASGVSASSLSRYLSGDRIPPSDSDTPYKLANGLAALAVRSNIGELDAEDVANELMHTLMGIDVDYETFIERLKYLLEALEINGNRLAHALRFDPSYISRILSKQRRPANMQQFIEGVSTYVSRNCRDEKQLAKIAQLTNCIPEDIASPHLCMLKVRTYLGSSESDSNSIAQPLDQFLTKLDEFDLNDFLESIHFDQLKVPTVPFRLPTTKSYTGIDEMKQAELDFLKAAVLSKSTEDIIFYSDMPIGEMAEDEEFPKKIMMGIALLIRKGIVLRNIHDVHRPLNELIMGLEGWIPVYMTGQIYPYYLETPTNAVFHHFLRSAGSVAVSGEAVAGNQASGRYIVTKNAADVAYYRRRGESLLSHAKPLMRIYRADRQNEMVAKFEELKSGAELDPVEIGSGTFKNIVITVYPNCFALIEKNNEPKISFLIEHPALVAALANFEPLLFERDELADEMLTHQNGI